MRERAVAAYLGLAVGDALGATVEFMTPREIAAQYKVHDSIRGGGWLRLKAGQVTDDTTMSLALGRAILERDGRVDAHAAARAFDEWMRARPVDIGNTVRRGLMEYRKTGVPVMPPSEHDAGNGAAMRILPVALATLDLPEEAIRAACVAQAHVTHNNPLSDAACRTLVHMLQDALAGADKIALLHQPRPSPGPPCIRSSPSAACRQVANPSGYVVDTLQRRVPGLSSTPMISSPAWWTWSTGAAMPTPPAPSPACWPARPTAWKPSPGVGCGSWTRWCGKRARPRRHVCSLAPARRCPRGRSDRQAARAVFNWACLHWAARAESMVTRCNSNHSGRPDFT
jgi:ADP-ribosyl-[dinitrogen reductase] hydrolase